ncbi:DUF4287 domain-containing protein [Arthrobacter sp. TMN-49]
MSFQAYLNTIEDKTGLTPRELLALAHDLELDKEPIKAGAIVDWLKEEYGLGRGHAMAIVHIVKNGPSISEKHVGSGGSHRDESTELWLDGQTNRPA